MAKIKGEKHGLCNVTNCQGEDDVTWYNYATEAYYCRRCAMRLNEDPHNVAYALANNKPPLCAQDEEEYQETGRIQHRGMTITRDYVLNNTYILPKSYGQHERRNVDGKLKRR